MTQVDSDFLGLAITEAEHAKTHGNHPFGATLVDGDGRVKLSAENTVLTQNDVTAHAELNLVRAATGKYTPEQLSTCTLYASAEPCPMCAGAIVWANIRRVVFGLGMEALYKHIGDAADAPSLKLHSRFVFEAAPWTIEVIGPMMEKEALIPHKDFW